MNETQSNQTSSSSKPPDNLAEPWANNPAVVWPIATVLLGSVTLVYLLRRNPKNSPELSLEKTNQTLSREELTEIFISAIPTVTRELNLEVATATLTETIERKSNRTLLGLNLGTNLAWVRVPVTYRYNIPLRGVWTLDFQEGMVQVTCPEIVPALPPSIHTEGIETYSQRGWGRWSADELLDQLKVELSETLSRYASDPQKMVLIRETSRAAVEEFVQLCFRMDPRLQPLQQSRVQVRFVSEPPHQTRLIT
jgi:hypothetical protein